MITPLLLGIPLCSINGKLNVQGTKYNVQKKSQESLRLAVEGGPGDSRIASKKQSPKSGCLKITATETLADN